MQSKRRNFGTTVGIFLLLGSVQGHGATLPSTTDFINIITVCGAGAGIKLDSHLEGSVASLYEQEKTQGKAALDIITKIIQLMPSDQRLDAYNAYLRCVFKFDPGRQPIPIVKACPDAPGQKICAALRGHHVIDVLVDRPNAVWVLASEPASGPTIGNPSGWTYPTRKVTLLKIRSLQDLSVADVTKLPITEDGIVYLDKGRVNVFLIYRVGDGTEYTNAGEIYTFNNEPFFDVGARSLFKYKNWGGFPMFIDGHLKYFSYDGYYWVIDDQPDGRSTPAEAHAEFIGKQAAKSFSILPAEDSDTIADGVADVTERYIVTSASR